LIKKEGIKEAKDFLYSRGGSEKAGSKGHLLTMAGKR